MKRLIPIAVAVIALSIVSVTQRYHDKVTTRTRLIDAASTDVVTTGPGGKTVITTSRGGAVLSPPRRAGLECAPGRNGGATDPHGVTGTSIKLGATVVKSGIGASFLKEVPIAMQAVVKRQNQAGGVCGRLLELKTVDDGWSPTLGETYIRNFISEGVFALAVSPSSEGLDAAIRNGDISRAGIPVVGADGMLVSQYTEPWVWPVAASTVTTMHVMAQNAAMRGAKTFGIVYDTSYHFGVEGEKAFKSAVARMHGTLKADVGIQSDNSGGSYKEEVNNFNTQCSPCDFVAMLLEPPAALQWIRDGGSFGSLSPGGTGGPQPLFVNSFAQACGQPCNGMWVWTGYTPPISPFDDVPAVVQYVNDVQSERSSADIYNPFVEGGYQGMKLLVAALERVGADLTRDRLREALDSMVLDTKLTVPLRWTPGNHFANSSVQAFSIVDNAGSFSAWRYERTGWIADPWVGQR